MKKPAKTENVRRCVVRDSTLIYPAGTLITNIILSYMAIRLMQEIEYESLSRRAVQRSQKIIFALFMVSLIALVFVLIAVAK